MIFLWLVIGLCSSNFKSFMFKLVLLFPVAQTLDSAIQRKISLSSGYVLLIKLTALSIHWVMIYPVKNVIHLSNSWALIMISWRKCFRLFITEISPFSPLNLDGESERSDNDRKNKKGGKGM